MEKNFKLGVIGCGFMASAIINGILSSNILQPKDIIVSDKNTESLSKFSSRGVNTTTLNTDVVNNAEFVLFAVKPQSLNDVLAEIKGGSCNKFISIMAGVKKAKIKSVFTTSKVARCMPNTPCSIGKGAVAIDISDYTEESDVAFIKNVFKALANVVFVNEDMLNTVTGVSGSSPAYFYLFVKGIVDAGVKNGLDKETALKLVASTMIGSGEMILKNKDKSLDDLITAVCSKGGTTIEAVKVYNENGLNDITDKAVDACIKRSKELENLL